MPCPICTGLISKAAAIPPLS